MLVYIWGAAILAALALYLRQIYSRFTKYGVNHNRPLPVLGDMGSLLIRLKSMVDVVNDLYTQFPEDKFVGYYEFFKPVVFIRDLELLKKVTVKDFEHFLDHRNFVSDEIDPFFGRNLFALKGQAWKDMRSTLSPAFTSFKMKHMLPFIVEVGNQMTRSLMKKLEECPTKTIDFDMKDLSTRYVIDVIASCAFGLKVDSHSEPHNHFYEMGCKSVRFGPLQLLKVFGCSMFPFIMKKMKMRVFTDETNDYFRNLVLSTMKDREAHQIIRLDMIHLLMEAKKGKLTHETSGKDADAGFAAVEESIVGRKTINRALSDIDLVAQGLMFFLAGFESVTGILTFLMYELVANPGVQERLAQEIREHEACSAGKFDYNAIQTLPYMDMVICEVLRLWPPIVTSDRMCAKEYNLGRPNDKATQDYIIKVGEALTIPIMAIQRDHRYFPNPMKFDPERFSVENKHKISPFTYIPFGVGPRNCIASRFALCQMKLMVYHLLREMEVMPSVRTRIPIQLSTECFSLRIKGGHWLRLRART